MIGSNPGVAHRTIGASTLKISKRTAIAIPAGLALALLITLLGLALAPPALLRVAANYSAKIVCSNVFLAGREPDTVLREDVQILGNPVLSLMRVSVDRGRGIVRAGVLGLFGGGLAIARPGRGCSVLPDGKLPPGWDPAAGSGTAAGTRESPANTALWPDGDAVTLNPALAPLLDDPKLAGPGMRAIVVVHHGRIVAERYASGFSARTPLLGWSMTKSVMAGIIGILIAQGRLDLEQSGFWAAAPGDARARIRLADLLSMSSGLRFDEQYAVVSDVTRMLYLQPDMATFARSQPLIHPIGEAWSYSSGTALILSRIVAEAAGMPAADFVAARLFDPLGMTTATIEADEHGTLVGSSYMYASARDWARYAQFLLQEGRWHDERLLPPGYVAMMASPVAASRGAYGHGQVWLWGSDASTPGVDPDEAYALPQDIFWMEGHDGQSIAILRSQELVVVRLGLTPHGSGYRPQALVQALLRSLG